MELYHLRTFVAVLEAQSISGAARQLAMTPSSVSAHIKAIETEFDVRLFVRTHQGVEITEKGRILAEHAQQTLQSANGFSQQAQALKQQFVDTVRLGMSVSADLVQLPQFLKLLNQTHPDIAIDLIQADTSRVLQDIKQNRLDMGIVFGDVTDKSLVAQQLKQAELVIAVPKMWANDIDASWDSLGSFPWIYTGDDCPFQAILERACSEQGIQPPRFIHTNNDPTRLELVCAGLGISILEQTDATHPDIHIVDSDRMTCNVTLVYLAHRQFDPLSIAIRDLVLQVI